MLKTILGKQKLRQRAPLLAGLATLASLLAVQLLLPENWREVLRERAFDLVLATDQRIAARQQGDAAARIVVVDIDRPSLEAKGAWPWPRDTIASLIEAVAAAKPAVIAIDILLIEADTNSPAALARRLGAMTGRDDLKSLAESLPDGDKRLAAVMRSAPVVLGFALDDDHESRNPIPAVPILARGTPTLDRLWRARWAAGPPPALAENVSGMGVLAVPARDDGIVRHVPLLVGVENTVHPGFALEAFRLAQQVSGYLVESEPAAIVAGEARIPLSSDALLRLLPVAAERHASRTVSAVDVMAKDYAGRLAGAIVLVGGSAPELGDRRVTPTDPDTPGVQIQADAVAQLFAGRVPRPLASAMVQPLLVLGLGALALAAGIGLAPLLGAVSVLSVVILAWGTSIGLSLGADRLVDPLTPSLVAGIVFVVASVTSYAVTRRREALVRRRFEQHLAPAVVQRIVEDPSLVKLDGERREITALFTDVEGFTSMTHRAGPAQLVTALDDYFEGLAAIVMEHGGMIDKIVGDAIHALFNAPFDLADHPRRAVDCAIAMKDWAQEYERRPGPAAIGFGRTRIGIETGQAIVGDVGIRAKLDYTAHGDAVNATARLEAANKDLGSTICVGPEAASRCDPALFRPLGEIFVRGREDEALAVWEPWPADIPAEWRERYLAAHALSDHDPETAAAQLDQLALERPHDPVPRRMAERLRAARAPAAPPASAATTAPAATA